MKVPIWKRTLMKIKAKKAYTQLYKQKEPFLAEIKEKVANLIELTDEKNHLHVITIICAEIVSGLEEEKDREFVMIAINETVKNL